VQRSWAPEHSAREDGGEPAHYQVNLGKLNNVHEALEITTARQRPIPPP
jgi:hypothetical protein